MHISGSDGGLSFSKPTNFMGDGWVRERLERLYMDGASAVAEAVTTMDECTMDSILTIIPKLQEINFSKISKFEPN